MRLSCARATDADIAALSARLDAVDHERSADESVRAGTDFHVALAGLSGNHFFADTVASAMVRLERSRWLVARSEEAWTEHREILDLAGAGDADGCAKALAKHYGHSVAHVLHELDPDYVPHRLDELIEFQLS